IPNALRHCWHMSRGTTMEDKSLIPRKQNGQALLGSIAGELGERSVRVYSHDAQAFAVWLQKRGITAETLDRQAITEYRAYLNAEHAPATAKRMFSVARRILDEQVRKGFIPANPAEGVKGIKAEDESPHIALSKDQANDLLKAIDTNTKKG